MNIHKLTCLALLGGTLAACGGGSSDGDSSSSSSVSSSSSSSVGGTPYEGDWASCDRFNEVQGFASLDGGTTGGADVGNGNYEVEATMGAEISSYLNNPGYADKPLTIYIDDLITPSSGSGRIEIRRDNVSIIGRSENAGFDGVNITVSHGASNVIIRNLTMSHVKQGDLITLDGQDGAVSNIWIDHNEFYNSLTAPEGATCADIGESAGCELDKDWYDELVSGRSEVHNVTISYNYMHDSWKTSLWGSSDNASEEDVGRNITFHHNRWEDVNSRLPLFRFGEGHVFNSYYHNVTGSGINVRMGAEMRIDGNVFENVKHPILSIDSTELGYWDVEDNIFENIEASGTCDGNQPPCRGAHEESTTSYVPGYNYHIMPAEDVKAYVLDYAGANTITECLALPEPDAGSGGDSGPKQPPQAWNIYYGDTLPDAADNVELEDDSTSEFTFGGDVNYFSLGSEAGTIAFDSTANAGHKSHMTINDVVNNTGDYPKFFTVLAGVTGNTDSARVLEIETAFADAGEPGSRLKTILRADDGDTGVQLEQANFGESVDNYELDMSQFRVYQVAVRLDSATTGDVYVYGDGSDTPLLILLDTDMRPTNNDGDNFLRIGDGGSHPYKSTVDWVIWTNENAYRPSDLKGHLPENIGDISGYEAEAAAE